MHYRFASDSALPIVHHLTHSLKICMYADDHAPPHFHLLGTDTACIIALSDLKVIAGLYQRRDMALAMDWADQNLATLRRLWSELNERE